MFDSIKVTTTLYGIGASICDTEFGFYVVTFNTRTGEVLGDWYEYLF